MESEWSCVYYKLCMEKALGYLGTLISPYCGSVCLHSSNLCHQVDRFLFINLVLVLVPYQLVCICIPTHVNNDRIPSSMMQDTKIVVSEYEINILFLYISYRYWLCQASTLTIHPIKESLYRYIYSVFRLFLKYFHYCFDILPTGGEKQDMQIDYFLCCRLIGISLFSNR